MCPEGVDTAIWESATVINSKITSSEKLVSLFFWRAKLLPANKAAGRILRATRKNRSVIFTDIYTKTCWRIYRLSPDLWLWLYERHTARKYREERVSSVAVNKTIIQQ